MPQPHEGKSGGEWEEHLSISYFRGKYSGCSGTAIKHESGDVYWTDCKFEGENYF